MRKFILNCLLFLIACAALCMGMLYITNLARPKLYNMNEAHAVILGNSHPCLAINDSLLPGIRNFARTGETADLLFPKLKLLHRYNPGLDTVYVCFDNALCYVRMHNYHLMRPEFYSEYSADDYLHIATMTTRDQFIVHFTHPFDQNKLLVNAEAICADSWDVRQSDNIGGFMAVRRDKLAEAIKRNQKKKPRKEYMDWLSKYFMDRTYHYCKANGLTLIFLVTPQHTLAPNREHYLRMAAKYYPDVPMLNFMDVVLPDSCYGDLDHLNYRGAAVFSLYLRDSIFSRPIRPGFYTDSL